MAHIKENEVDIMKVYNNNHEVNRKFFSEIEFRDNTISRYKQQRGFPLKLNKADAHLYAIEDGIGLSTLEKIKEEKDKEKQLKEQQKPPPKDDRSNSLSIDTDSCEEEFACATETERIRKSNPEKRTSKFDPLSSLSLVRTLKSNDVKMKEESKSEVSQDEEEEQPPAQRFSDMSDFIKNNIGTNQDPLDS